MGGNGAEEGWKQTVIAMCQLSQLNSMTLELLYSDTPGNNLHSIKVASKILNVVGLTKVLWKGSTVHYVIVLSL